MAITLALLPRGVIGNTSGFGPLILGSSPSGVTSNARPAAGPGEGQSGDGRGLPGRGSRDSIPGGGQILGEAALRDRASPSNALRKPRRRRLPPALPLPAEASATLSLELRWDQAPRRVCAGPELSEPGHRVRMGHSTSTSTPLDRDMPRGWATSMAAAWARNWKGNTWLGAVRFMAKVPPRVGSLTNG